jgi:hypothetical protein
LTEREKEIDRERKELEKKMHEKKSDIERTKGVQVKPSTFAESVYLLDGRPFRLKNRDFLLPIYNWPIEEGMMMCGRQVEKSTTFSVKIANDALQRNFYRGLYFAPLNEQVKVFSEDRLGRLFKYSRDNIIKKEFMTRDDKQNVFNKSFSSVGSLIYLRHAYGNGDNIRGISVNGIYGDEIQDIYVDALPVIGETQAHALDLGPGIKITWYAGTPKTYSNTIQQTWNRSNQMEWVVRCLHCGTDQVLGRKNITPDKYICRKCGKELNTFNISKNGQWVKMNRDSDMYGFRISQMMSPSMRAKDVYKKMQNYPEGKFFNEVLGRSYEHALKPLPRYFLMQLFDPDEDMMTGAVAPYANEHFFMGIDWGHGTKSFTVVVIGMVTKDGKFKIVYTRKFKEGKELEISYQLKEIYRLIAIFKINYCVGDYGDGFTQGQDLKKRYGQRFDMCYYSWNQKLIANYDQKNRFWVVNRDRALYWYVEDVKSKKVIWPGANKNKAMHLVEDHEVLQIEYRTQESKSPDGNVATQRSNDMMFTHPIDKPDDSVHASFYSWFASRVVLGIPIDPTTYETDKLQVAGSQGEGYGTIL